MIQTTENLEPKPTQEKIWLENYDPMVVHSINPDAYTSLVPLFDECFHQHADKICYSNFGVTLTYAQVEKLTRAFACFLQQNCGLVKGDRVAIMLPNIMQYPIALLGALIAGLVVVNINPNYTPRELKHILNDSGAKCVVALENAAYVLEEVLPKTRIEKIILTQVGDLLGAVKGSAMNFFVKHIKKLIPNWEIPDAYHFNDAIKIGSVATFQAQVLNGQDIAFLQYTGGTTGKIHGAVLTHRNIVANILQSCAWFEPVTQQKFNGGIVTALPLYHIFSLMANCLVFFRIGISNILITDPKNMKRFVKELQRQPFSFMSGVNTLFNALMNNKEFCHLNFSNFRFALGGGIAVYESTANKWQKLTDAPLLQAYGLTEASPAVCISPLYMHKFADTVGLPLPSTEIKICDEEGHIVSYGEPGELYIKGPQVMKGYWKQPKLNKEVLTDDLWLKTGDIATLDDKGFIRIVDRKKDLINISGFKVYPNEVEEVISSMKEVREVAVVGVKYEKNKKTNEIVKAFIVRRDPNLTVQEILNYCHTQLTDYKVPKEIEFRIELPKSNVGKILRHKLKENKEAPA